MSLTKGKPKKISQRHYFGNGNGLSGTVLTELSKSVQTIESKARGYQLKRKKKLCLPIRYGYSKFETADPYAPLWNNGSTYSILYGETLKSKDLYNEQLGFKIKPHKAGIYRVDCTTIVTPSNAAVTAWTSHTLFLYKNGTIYSTLDSNTVLTAFGVGQNYYDAYDVLKGFDRLYLDIGDYIEIKYTFAGGQPFGVLDTVYSRLLINYETIQGEEI